MKEIVERLTENRQVELAKKIMEANGYKVTKISKRLKESVGGEEDLYYQISIDANTNAPGTKYTQAGERAKAGAQILAAAGISDSNIEIDCLGYDDITFIVKSDNVNDVKRIAKKIAAYAEEPSDLLQDEYEGGVVKVSGPWIGEFMDEVGPGWDVFSESHRVRGRRLKESVGVWDEDESGAMYDLGTSGDYATIDQEGDHYHIEIRDSGRLKILRAKDMDTAKKKVEDWYNGGREKFYSASNGKVRWGDKNSTMQVWVK